MIDFAITPLSERPEFAGACAAWSFAEWGCQNETSTLEQTLTRYKKTAQGKDLPATWICIHKDKPAGMASLKMNDHPDFPDIFPWLASLFVHPEYREQGIAKRLINTIEEQAADLYGFKDIYLFTAHAQKLYETLGYKEVQRVRDPTGLHPDGDLLMKKDLV